jgi:hypothetical protein
MFIALDRFARRQRRRLMLVAAVLALSGVVVVAHSVIGADHMGDDTVMCVAVLEIGALAVAAIVAAPRRQVVRPAWASLPRALPTSSVPASPPEPRARAAPVALQVFRL